MNVRGAKKKVASLLHEGKSLPPVIQYKSHVQATNSALNISPIVIILLCIFSTVKKICYVFFQKKSESNDRVLQVPNRYLKQELIDFPMQKQGT